MKIIKYRVVTTQKDFVFKTQCWRLWFPFWTKCVFNSPYIFSESKEWTKDKKSIKRIEIIKYL